MKSKLYISIIVPVYNVEMYLEECLDSILSQTYKNYEVICVNDGSTDDSYAILCRYANENEKIRIINNTCNRGQSYARNRGLEIAAGDYIVFVDSDDMLIPDALERLTAQVMEENPVDIIYYDMAIKDERSGRDGNIEPESEKKDSANRGKAVLVKYEEQNPPIVEVCRQMIKKDFLEHNQIAFYEGIYHEDVLFSFHCGLKTEKAFYLPENLYIYRKRENSTMTTMNFKRAESIYMVLIELWKYWRSGEWTEEINLFFEDFLNKWYMQFLKVSSYFSGKALCTTGNAADCFLYQILMCDRSTAFRHVDFGAKEIRQIELAREIMVYGAGEVGVEVVRYLRMNHISVSKVLVTEKKFNPERVFDIPVVEFDAAEIPQDTVIIVGILNSNHAAVDSIINRLRSRKFFHYIMYNEHTD